VTTPTIGAEHLPSERNSTEWREHGGVHGKRKFRTGVRARLRCEEELAALPAPLPPSGRPPR
jgi:hypothetical protein